MLGASAASLSYRERGRGEGFHFSSLREPPPLRRTGRGFYGEVGPLTPSLSLGERERVRVRAASRHQQTKPVQRHALHGLSRAESSAGEDGDPVGKGEKLVEVFGDQENAR